MPQTNDGEDDEDDEIEIFMDGENITKIKGRDIPKPMASNGNGIIKYESDPFSKDLAFSTYVSI